MSAISIRAEGIAAVRRELLVDRCTVTRTGAQGDDVDPDTGLPTPGTSTTVHSDLPCWFKSPAVVGIATYTAGDVTALQRPVFSTDVEVGLYVGDIVTCTASITASNVGKRLRIKAIPVGTFLVRQPYEVEVVTG